MASPAPASVAVQVDPQKPRARLIDLLCAATAELHMQEKELAFYLGVDQPYLSRIKGGEKSLRGEMLEHLARQTEADAQALLGATIAQVARCFGLVVTHIDPRAHAVGDLLRAIGGVVEFMDAKRIMAKASLR